MGSHGTCGVLLSLSFHHVVEGEVGGRRPPRVEDGHVLIKLDRVLPSAKYQLVLGEVAPMASEPPVKTTVVVEVHGALGHDSSAG